MRRYLLTALFSLLALLAWAQGTSTVSGTVYNANGAPVPNWLVYALAGDSTQWGPVTIGPVIAITDANGVYTAEVPLPPAVATVTVLTDNGCLPVSAMLNQVAPVVNGAATADFFICGDLPQNPDCSAYIWYEPTSDSLALVLHADFWSVDGTAAAAYLWDFGDGSTSTEANPTHAFPGSGEYLVTLTVTSAAGCTATVQTFVWVGNDPWPGGDCWAWVQAIPVDSLTFSFTAQAFSGILGDTIVGVSYFWDFGDGTTSTEANPTHTYAQHGVYDVSVMVTTIDSCMAFGFFPLWTDQPPLPDCRAYILQTPLDTTTFSFAAQGWTLNGSTINMVSYNWDFGDGATSMEANPTHTYAQPGLYTVSLTGITDDSCEIYACDVVMACACPIDTFWYSCQAMFGVGYSGGFDPSGNPAGGDPLTMTFWDMSLGAVSGWTWSFGDGTSSSEQNPTHTYTAEGLYVVTLSITTLDDCTSSVSFEIYVGDDFPWIPEPDCQALFIPMPDSLGGTGIQFVDYSWSPLPITGWSWDFGDGSTSTEQNPYHVYAQSGSYTVSLTITGDSCNSVISFEVDTDSPWLFANQPAAFGQSGLASAAHEPAAFSDLRLAPNPAIEAVTLTFNAVASGGVELRLSDMSGRILQSSRHSLQAGLNALRMPVNTLTPGLYTAQLVGTQGTKAIRFVKR